MKLVTKAQHEKLRLNSKQQTGYVNFDPKPVVKLFHPVGGATWLLTELEEDGNLAFGLCDLGIGCPELGYVSLDELRSIQIDGLGVERDRFFAATKPISEYATEAYAKDRIVA